MADAYKMKMRADTEYAFGVEGFGCRWAGSEPTIGRGGSVQPQAVQALQEWLSCTHGCPLRQTSKHSRRALDGRTWSMDFRSECTDHYVCVAATSSWISKESYHVANAFFTLDAQSQYVDPSLKVLLEMALQEYQPDTLVANLGGMQRIHIRVGRQDYTTHPYYSRRMHRTLTAASVNSTLEEVSAKQHWWWDTRRENDGGVVNDARMRAIYAECLETSYLHRRENHALHEIDTLLIDACGKVKLRRLSRRRRH